MSSRRHMPIINMKLPIYFWFELLSLIVCLVNYKKIKETPLRWFLPFLAIIVTYEYGILSKWDFFFIDKRNHWLANIISTLEILFYSFIFYQYINSIKVKKIILYSSVIFLLFTILNIVLIQGYNSFHTITYRIGSILIIWYLYHYFRQLLKTEEEIILVKYPMFWISTGLLFFFLGFFFYLSAFDFIAYQSIKTHAYLYKIIRFTLIIQMYAFFSISFIWKQKPMK